MQYFTTKTDKNIPECLINLIFLMAYGTTTTQLNEKLKNRYNISDQLRIPGGWSRFVDIDNNVKWKNILNFKNDSYICPRAVMKTLNLINWTETRRICSPLASLAHMCTKKECFRILRIGSRIKKFDKRVDSIIRGVWQLLLLKHIPILKRVVDDEYMQKKFLYLPSEKQFDLEIWFDDYLLF